MRVTQNTNYDTIRDSIHRSRSRMEGLQQQSATLKKLNTPSDDPVGASKVLEIRTDKVNNDQFQMNAKIAEAFLNNSDHSLGELAEIVVRAKEIALSQASGASSNDDTRLAIAEEVTQLFQQSVATANRRIGERYIFGGYKTQHPPIDADGNYQGDDGQMMTEIAKGVFLAMNVHGLEAFNTNPKAAARFIPGGTKGPGGTNGPGGYEDSRVQRSPAGTTIDNGAVSGAPDEENVNVFDELQNLRIALLAGDSEGLRNTLERFDQLHAKLIAVRAKVGSRVQGLHSMSQSTERHNITNAQLSSALEDADMAQVVSDLAKEETIFRSALASSQKLIQPTLLDFLK